MIYYRISELCLCSIFGDTHVRTYDGSRLDFKSSCTHLLTKTVDAEKGKDFSVQFSNHRTTQRYGKSLNRSLRINVYGTDIEMRSDGRVLVCFVYKFML